MAQRKQVTWSELRVGLFVIVGLVVLAVAIFYVTGAGFLGPKYRIRTYLPEVSGLAPGAPVKLDGVVIGNVDDIQLVPRNNGKPPDPMHNIMVDMRLDKKFQDEILTDSTASLVTEGLLGNRYVNIQRGFTGTPIQDGQTVPAGEVTDLMANFKILSGQVSEINDDLYVKVDKGVDQITAILSDVREQKGTIGKLLYDPSLYDEAKKALDNGSTLISDLKAGKGTLGKLVTDETLYNKLRDASTNIDTASAKLNKSDNTVGKLFNDPQLYDNVTALTADMRKFLEEFRKN